MYPFTNMTSKQLIRPSSDQLTTDYDVGCAICPGDIRHYKIKCADDIRGHPALMKRFLQSKTFYESYMKYEQRPLNVILLTLDDPIDVIYNNSIFYEKQFHKLEPDSNDISRLIIHRYEAIYELCKQPTIIEIDNSCEKIIEDLKTDSFRTVFQRYSITKNISEWLVRKITYNQKICAMCYKQAGKKCSRCDSIRYCSKDCQAKHWPIHKHECK
jgi:hypothetical protein